MSVKRSVLTMMWSAVFMIAQVMSGFAAPVVVVPGESAGYVYYQTAGTGGNSTAPVEDHSFVGMVAAFSTTPPTDTWVECKGQAISSATYPYLVEFLTGNPAAVSATMPNYQGYFLRGVNTGATGIDPGRTLGSAQTDAIRNITGWFGPGFYSEFASVGANGAFYKGAAAVGTKFTGEPWTMNGGAIGLDASLVVPTASENRPANIAVIYAMRAK